MILEPCLGVVNTTELYSAAGKLSEKCFLVVFARPTSRPVENNSGAGNEEFTPSVGIFLARVPKPTVVGVPIGLVDGLELVQIDRVSC